jgi:hypothetical protein
MVVFSYRDLRKLNTHSHKNKYSIKDTREWIGEIGRANLNYHSAIDLTLGYWQMMLEPQKSEFPAFIVPGIGQYELVSAPQ